MMPTTTTVFASCVFFVSAVMSATPRIAMADGAAAMTPAPTPSPSPVPESEEETHWYGYQTLATDAAGALLLWRGLSTYRTCPLFTWEGPPDANHSCAANNDRASAMILGGALLYQFGAPTVHAVNGGWDKAGYSFGARFLPVLGGILVNGLTHDDDTGSVVIIGGMATVMIFDSLVLARKTVPAASSSLKVAPAYDPRSRTAAVTVGGTL